MHAPKCCTDIDRWWVRCVCEVKHIFFFIFVCNFIPLLWEIKQVTKMLNTMQFLSPIFVSFHFIFVYDVFLFLPPSSIACSKELPALIGVAAVLVAMVTLHRALCALVHCAHSTWLLFGILNLFCWVRKSRSNKLYRDTTVKQCTLPTADYCLLPTAE